MPVAGSGAPASGDQEITSSQLIRRIVDLLHTAQQACVACECLEAPWAVACLQHFPVDRVRRDAFATRRAMNRIRSGPHVANLKSVASSSSTNLMVIDKALAVVVEVAAWVRQLQCGDTPGGVAAVIDNAFVLDKPKVCGQAIRFLLDNLETRDDKVAALEEAGINPGPDSTLLASDVSPDADDRISAGDDRNITEDETAPTERMTIYSFGNRNYALGADGDRIIVTDPENNVLQTFIEYGPALDGESLRHHSGQGRPDTILKRLREKYRGRFEPAITMPQTRGNGGYRVRIRDAHANRDA